MHDEHSTPAEKSPNVDPAGSPENTESSDVFSLIEDVERHLSRIRSAQSRQAEEFADLATRMNEVEDAEKTLSSRQVEIDEAQAKLNNDKVLNDHSRVENEELRATVDQMKVECDEAQNAINHERAEFEKHQALVEQREKDLAESREQFESQFQDFESQRTEFKKTSEESQEKLSHLENDLQELTAFKEKAESSIEEYVCNVRDLGEELDCTKTALSNLEQITSELTTRAESAEAATTESENQCAALMSECETARNQLRKAGERLGELAQVVSEQVPQLEEGAAAMATVHEQARMISELEARLAHHSEDAPDSSDLVDHLEMRIAELTTKLESAQEMSGDEDRITALNDECDKARRRADELEQALSVSQDKGQAQEFAKQLRSKGEHLTEFARHLERRRNRLVVMREALKSRPAVSPESATFHELQKLKTEHADIKQARECLLASEQKMMRNWARPRAFATVTWMAILTMCVLAGSWFAVTRTLPLAGVASVDLTAATRSGRPLEGTAINGWLTWHEALPKDPAFIAAVSKRLDARGLSPVGGEEGVATMMMEDLAIDSDGPGKIRLILSGEDRRTLASTLDVIATTMASESSRQAPRREQSARAMIVGEKSSKGLVGYASLLPMQINATFLERFALISGIGLATTFTFAGLMYMALRRAKRVFEESEVELESDGLAV